jgi:hypothetical protein
MSDLPAEVGHSWQEAITRRVRVLLRTAPLHRVESNKARKAIDWSKHDLRGLALRILDLTIESMGLSGGVPMEELRIGLRPLLRSVDEALDDESCDEIANAIIESLLNESDRRQAFSEPYLDLSAETPKQSVLRFHLLRERQASDGSTLIVATTEGINLYAGMLDYPVEDAQSAEEAVLRSQIRRGKIHDAVETAKRARLRSIEYEQKISTILETARRDVSQIEWVRDVLVMIADARTHIEERLISERDILRAIEDRLEMAQVNVSGQLAMLRQTLYECLGRHMRLHERLISANGFYLQEQERQSFRPRMLAPLPDPEAELLRPFFLLTTGVVAKYSESILAIFQAPRAPKCLRLTLLLRQLLASRRETIESRFNLGLPALEPIMEPPPFFDKDDRLAVDAILANRPVSCHLSELLSHAREQGAPYSTLRLLCFDVLAAFDDADARIGRVQPANHLLRDIDFAGDDLVLEGNRHA